MFYIQDVLYCLRNPKIDFLLVKKYYPGVYLGKLTGLTINYSL